MAIGYKTLILIDNSKSVGEANFTLCKETAKYIVAHMNEADTARVATFGEGIEYITDYTGDTVLLTESIEKLDRVERDTYITDNLAEIIMEWNKQDVACRNIILFTDGDEKEPVRHANEELYYLVKEAGYPVYVVQSIENKNISASKNLSAVATLSNGELVLTEFEGSEGGSEQIMGDRILTSINDMREDTVDEVEQSITEEADTEDLQSEESAEVLYIENSREDAASDAEQAGIEFGTVDNTPIIRGSGAAESTGISLNVLLPAAGLLIAVLLSLTGFILIRKSRTGIKRDGRFKGSPDEELNIEARIAEDAEDYDCLTYKLDEDCGATRILDREGSGRSIVLEDCSDPTRLYRAMCDDSLVVGRSGNLCDIVIDNDDSVSARHCELSLRGDNWYIKDLRSSNGTRVNAQKVFQELLLTNGDIVSIGRSALQVRI